MFNMQIIYFVIKLNIMSDMPCALNSNFIVNIGKSNVHVVIFNDYKIHSFNIIYLVWSYYKAATRLDN